MTPMTRLGKILVFVNLVLALGFMAWGIGIAGNRIDWGKTPEKPGRAKGKLLEREEQFAEAKRQYEAAVARYNDADRKLRGLEKRRPEDQKYYRDELAKLETGMDAGGKMSGTPVLELVYDKGVLKLDPQQRPLLRPIDWQRPNQPLLDLTRLGQEFEKTHEELKKEKAGLEVLLAQEKTLTEQLNGDGRGKKGLRKQMDEVQEALVQCLGEKEFLQRMEKAKLYVTVSASTGREGEQEYLKRRLYNRKADLLVVQARQRRLESRLEELKNIAATALQR
jgi:hypothetical protein